MNNDILEKALQSTWDNKERFYEAYKDIPFSEIIQALHHTHKAWIDTHNPTTYSVPHSIPAYTFVNPNR